MIRRDTPCSHIKAEQRLPNEASCLRLIRALRVEKHELWQEESRYLNMDLLAERKKETLRAAA